MLGFVCHIYRGQLVASAPAILGSARPQYWASDQVTTVSITIEAKLRRALLLTSPSINGSERNGGSANEATCNLRSSILGGAAQSLLHNCACFIEVKPASLKRRARPSVATVAVTIRLQQN
jgi:hypothetical protein